MSRAIKTAKGCSLLKNESLELGYMVFPQVVFHCHLVSCVICPLDVVLCYGLPITPSEHIKLPITPRTKSLNCF